MGTSTTSTTDSGTTDTFGGNWNTGTGGTGTGQISGSTMGNILGGTDYSGGGTKLPTSWSGNTGGYNANLLNILSLLNQGQKK